MDIAFYFARSVEFNIRVVCPILGNPVLTPSLSKFKFLQVKNSFRSMPTASKKGVNLEMTKLVQGVRSYGTLPYLCDTAG